MKTGWFFILGLLLLPSLAFASVVINEIMYDLEGADENREWVEIFNDSSTEINLSGWTFNDGDTATNHGLNEPPKNGGQGSLVIPPQSYAILADDAAIFLTDHSNYAGTVIDTIVVLKNTIATLKLLNSDKNEISFVNYDKILGAAGDGNSLQYVNGNWVAAIPTPGAANSSSQSSSQQPENQSLTDDSSQYIPPENLPQIKAYAGKDRTVTVGASAEFRGQAFGLEDEPLDNARYLWTFGDGTSKEGQNITHFYQYPGEYIVVLNVSSGEYSASDYLLAKAVPNKLFISEIKTGSNGWLELFNNSKEQLDISGWQLKSGPPAGEAGSKIFIFPKSTLVRPNAYLVIPVSVSGLVFPNGKNSVELLYAGGFKADGFNYDGLLKEGQSFNRSKETSLIAQESPGAINIILAQKERVASQAVAINSSSLKNENANPPKNSDNLNNPSSNAEEKSVNGEESKQQTASAANASGSWKFYLLAVLGLIIFSSAGVLFVRRHGQP